jgi:hypothetical protein
MDGRVRWDHFPEFCGVVDEEWGLEKLPIPNRIVPVYFQQIPFSGHNARLTSTWAGQPR